MNQALTEAVYYILLSLLDPMHGYGIMQRIEELTKGRLLLAAGTLYGALSSLEEKEWIQLLPGNEDSRRKEYLITKLGQTVLTNEIQRLQELIQNGTRLLEEQNEKGI